MRSTGDPANINKTVRRIEANQAILERRVVALEAGGGPPRPGIGYQAATASIGGGSGSGGSNATTVRANPYGERVPKIGEDGKLRRYL